jgi:hypothetical protein
MLAFSIKSIDPGDCRRSGLFWNTFRKYLRAEGGEPKFNAPERSSKLDPFQTICVWRHATQTRCSA